MVNRTHDNRPSGGHSQPTYGMGGGRSQGGGNKSFNELADDVLRDYFKSGLFDEILKMGSSKNLDILLEETERFVRELGSQLTTGQIRNVYDKAIKANDLNELKMIRPQLAYIAGREKNDNQKKFLAFLDKIIKLVQSEEQQKNFNVFFEAIIAYHKYYGKNN